MIVWLKRHNMSGVLEEDMLRYLKKDRQARESIEGPESKTVHITGGNEEGSFDLAGFGFYQTGYAVCLATKST